MELLITMFIALLLLELLKGPLPFDIKNNNYKLHIILSQKFKRM